MHTCESLEFTLSRPGPGPGGSGPWLAVALPSPFQRPVLGRAGHASATEWGSVLFHPTCFYSPPLAWGEEVGLDLFSELHLMSVSVLWLCFCFL